MTPCIQIPDGPEIKATLNKLLWAKLKQGKPGECWLWQGTVTSSGYPKLHLNRRQLSAHRVSYHLHNGPIPENLWVLHRCDTKTCCNPDHLWLGTPRENTRDCVQKGRWTQNRKLSSEQVRQVRYLSLGGMNSFEIAERFGVGASCIRNILAGITWRAEGFS